MKIILSVLLLCSTLSYSQNKKISQLPVATTPLSGAELVEVVQGGVNKKVAASALGATGGGGTVTSVGLSSGTTGTDVNITGSPVTGSGTITLNIPSASTVNRGLVTTGTQTITGAKTLVNSLTVGDGSSVGSFLGAGAPGFARFFAGGFSLDYGINSAGNYAYSSKPIQTPGLSFTTSTTGNDTQSATIDIGATAGTAIYGHRAASNVNQSGATFRWRSTSAFGVGFLYDNLTISNAKTYDIASGSGSSYRSLSILGDYNVTGGTSTIVAIDYAPTETSMTGVTHIGLRIRSAGALNGFGIGATTPLATMHVLGTTMLDGSVTLPTAGNGILIKEGTNATMGVATLVAGTVVVSTTKVTANSRIFLTGQNLGTITVPVGYAVSARTAGTSFTILSANIVDTSTVGWCILEPAP